MELARNRQLVVWPKDQHAEGVRVVHHVEEGEPGEGPRRGQNLEEGAVSIVVRITITGTPVVTTTQPRSQLGQNLRLDAGLHIERAGTLPLRPPPACLHGTPEQQVESPGT